ncbi:MAG: hypothetical protein P4L44_10560 [Oryzomonas sp.]|uniref:hypothetical protein n=1 Tax=Oryzomonas sp. TaxID=2855186 RepID=UPI00284B5EA6|nr:hypothetical protein [Oryzomonas sp.]MDR3580393.1 hypothetical protein [Oryzomonas sp.]
MKKMCLLLLVLVAVVGCGKGKSKEPGKEAGMKPTELVIIKYSSSGLPKKEKQKAVDWISNNNIWGPVRKPKGIIEVVEGYINGAIQAGDKKTRGSNIYIAINGKSMKSGKNMIITWQNNTFSVREMTPIETSTMKIPDFGLKMDAL